MAKTALIVGAGAAGLSCAAELARAGLQVTVLEGRDRIGGRIFTQHVSGVAAPIELGAEFVHGKPPQIFKPTKAAGEEVIEFIGDDWCREEGELCACEFFEKVEVL